MATEADIKQRVRDYLYGAFPNERTFVDTITSSYVADATSIDVSDGSSWEKGDILENSINGDQYYVTAEVANTLTVIPSWNGTTSVGSSGTDDPVYKNPRFTDKMIEDAIKETLNALPGWGLHGFNTNSFSLVASQYFYELADGDIDRYGVLGVYYVEDTTEEPVRLPFRWSTELSTSPSEWAQAEGVTLLSKGDRASTATVYYTYAQSYEFDTDLTTTLAKVLPQHEELVVLGAVARLAGHAVLPSTHDPGARTDRTVQSGQEGRDKRDFLGEFLLKARKASADLAIARRNAANAGGAVRTNRVRRWRP